MAFPSLSNTKAPALALHQIQSAAEWIKTNAGALRDESALGNIRADRLMKFPGLLYSYRQQIAEAATTPGIGQYAKDQFNNQAFDIVAEYNAMVSAIDNTIAWITTNFPNSGGDLRVYTFDANGNLVSKEWTPAQTAGLRAQIDALVSTIS